MKKNQLVYVTFIRTTPKKLWDVITKPEFTRQYWAGLANVSDWKKGSPWQHVTAGKKPEIYVTGEVLECKPPKRLVLTWIDPDDPSEKSRVTFEIERLKDVVSLRVTHAGLTPRSGMEKGVSWGWPRVLSSLKSFLETGEGLNVYTGH
jgi:uncharacterized protein YndB with AHSA1/START domain